MNDTRRREIEAIQKKIGVRVRQEKPRSGPWLEMPFSESEVKVLLTALAGAEQELAAANERLAEIDKWVKADADDLAKMRDGAKLTRAGLVATIVELQLQVTEANERAAKERERIVAWLRERADDRCNERDSVLRYHSGDIGNEIDMLADAIERGSCGEKGGGDGTAAS
jgi:hypothetical protein